MLLISMLLYEDVPYSMRSLVIILNDNLHAITIIYYSKNTDFNPLRA